MVLPSRMVNDSSLEGDPCMAHPPSLPHTQQGRLRTYTLPGAWQALVGRTDADNDYLSFRVARPDDWWFHVRGMPGSHVILQGPPGADPDRETLHRAAAIAAYHSKARTAGVVAVSGTRVRDVSKPRGAKAGTVQIRHEKIFKVRPASGDVAGEPCHTSASSR
jgi:predicted ribosome quality control (RQC) complex YloA/Tae2 family protein